MTDVVLMVTRDSASLGDSIDAPHEETVRMRRITQTDEFVHQLRVRYQLPAIQGSKHAWACILNSEEIAVFKQTKPSCVALVQELKFAEVNKVHFKYYSQGRPEISGANEALILQQLKERITTGFRRITGRG